MTTVHGYAANTAAGPLEAFEYELGSLKPDEVDINVEYCGVCHSDLSMLNNDWEMTEYPFMPGHEAAGRVAAVGDKVTHLKVGDRVGLGWHAGYCMTCDQCLDGHHNLCSHAAGTIVGRHGAFADRVRAKAVSVAKIPDELGLKDAGPLFCGGMAVFGPLAAVEMPPTGSVAVLGIGGLGHLALQFARAWGCHVTAFTSESKLDEAKELGAHESINSRDPEAIAAAEGRFDLILSTVNVKQDWNAYINALKPRGRLHLLGAVLEPLELNLMPIMFGDRTIGASPVGPPAVIRKMLTFSARHQILPVTEHFPISKVNDAMEHLRSGDARYRIVLDLE